MRTGIKRWQAFSRYVFNFRKPTLLDLQCIDLVADKKLLFLLAWNTANTGVIKVNPGKHCYTSPVGAAILTLPPATASVDIIIRNCWRRRKVNIPLRLMKLDQESLLALIDDLQIFKKIIVEKMQPDNLSITPAFVFGSMQIKQFVFQANVTLRINHSKFSYHEPRFLYQS